MRRRDTVSMNTNRTFTFNPRIALSWIEHPRFIGYACLVVFVLHLPALGMGWIIDDTWHRLGYSQLPAVQERFSDDNRMAGIFGLYRFLDGDSETLRYYKNLGLSPWWADESIRIAFFRPVAGMLANLDYALWPTSAAAMHLHSLVWYGVFLGVIVLFYKRFLSTPFAVGLVVALAAVDETITAPSLWIANRHTLLAAVFGLPALIAHKRWIDENAAGWGALAWMWFALSLLASEGGVAWFGYLIAFALFVDRRSWMARLRALVPYGMIMAAWRVVYNWLGYGVEGSGVYVDPVREPIQFMMSLLVKYPIYLNGIILWPPSDAMGFLTDASAQWVAVASLGLAAALFAILFPLWRNVPAARFFLAGALLSLAPLCASPPSNRSLVYASVGIMGFYAICLDRCVLQVSNGGYRNFYKRLLIVVFSLLGIAHLLLPLNDILNTPYGMKFLHEQTGRLSLANEPDLSLEGKHLVFINPSCTLASLFTIPIRLLNQLDLPDSFLVLANGIDRVRLTRTDERTIELIPQFGYYPPAGVYSDEMRQTLFRRAITNAVRMLERLVRDERSPSQAGERYRINDTTITVMETTGGGRPHRVEFQFSRPLDAPSFLWMVWNQTDARYERFTMPGVGESVEISIFGF